jgi:cellulose synthase/poly-beta-1,6-N-acetylglucosamine synthase-like glycosyltransferase
MSNALNVSVIICAYTEDRWNDLVAAVQSVRAQSSPAYEIIVVIDHNPRLLERSRSEIPGIVVVDNNEPRGLSGARNSGLAVARGDVIAFMDEDAAAARDWLQRLMSGYDNPNVIGVGGAIEPVWVSGRPRWFPNEFDWVVGCTYKGMPTTSAPVRNLIGCNMSFRREAFEAVGGFRSGIGRIGTRPVGCEETELCIRARQHWPEKTFLYDPEARVYHRVPATRVGWSYFRSRCYSEGLSKALVSQFVGADDGLASERTYTFRTLPSGILRNLAGVVRGDAAGPLRAGAITSGLAITTIGYAVGLASRKIADRRAASNKKWSGVRSTTTQ